MEEELKYCARCKNAKLKESFCDKDGKKYELWFCGKHRTFITENTLAKAILGCKGKDYE